MVYNLTQIAGNGTSLLGMTKGVNEVLMFGWLGTLMMLGLAMIFYIAFVQKTGDVGKSLSATSFLIFLLTLLLTAVNLITNPLVIFLSLIACGATVAFTWKRGN